jgi:phenylacetate-CoA ligase
MIVYTFTVIFEQRSEIKQFKVVQNQRESITTEYIPDEGFTDDILDSLRKKIINQLDEEIIIHFEQKEIIPPTPSGKPQIVISQIKY